MFEVHVYPCALVMNLTDEYIGQPETAFRVFSVYGQQVSSVQLLLIGILLFVV